MNFEKIFKRDRTLGILFIVISLYFILFSYNLANKPDTFTWIAIFIFVVLGQKLFSFGYHLFFGIIFLKEKQ